MRFLTFERSELIQEVMQNGFRPKQGVGKTSPRAVYFVPYIAVELGSDDAELAENEFGLPASMYFWNLILRTESESRDTDFSAFEIELDSGVFPVKVFADMTKEVVVALSKLLTIRSDEGIKYDSDRSLEDVLGQTEFDKFILETRFQISNISSLLWFIDSFFAIGGKPWGANSFVLSTDNEIPSKNILSITKF